jgi:SAM-dependent methyltransferase
MSKTPPKTDHEIAEAWTGDNGVKWLNSSSAVDAMIRPVGEAALAAARPRPNENVIDVGCGDGPTTVRLAELVAPNGRVTGLDVSNLLVDAAKKRAASHAAGSRISFKVGNAAQMALPKGEADLLFSRFGVMFFEHPTAAFQNLRSALKPNGRLAFVCWQPINKVDFLFVPFSAVATYVSPPARPGPEDPGPFSFGDPVRVRRILEGAGFKKIEIEPFGTAVFLGTSLDEAVKAVTMVGPASQVLADAPADLKEKALQSVRDALAARQTDAGIALQAATWIVTARAS